MSINKAFMLEIWSEFFFLYISHFFDIILIFDMHNMQSTNLGSAGHWSNDIFYSILPESVEYYYSISGR